MSHSDDDVLPSRRRGFREKDAYADLQRLCPEARVILDIGAFEGWTVQKFRRLFPQAEIHAFEPHRPSFDQLEARFADDAQVRKVNQAAGAAAGEGRLFTYSLSVTNALSPFIPGTDALLPDGLTAAGESVVAVTSLDRYADEVGLDRIDVLKMDTQGAELDILSGAARLLAERRIGLILTETIFVPLYQRQPRFDEIAARLHDHGLKLFDFYDFVYAEDGQVKWGDCLFRLAEA